MKFVAFERAKQGTGASRRLRNTRSEEHTSELQSH